MSMTPFGGDGELLYRLNERDEIVFVNEAWNDFARANAGDDLVEPRVLGRSLWEFVTDATTRQLYRDVLRRVRGGRQVRLRLRCDTPVLRRLLELDVYQGPPGTIDFRTRVIWIEHREYQALLEPDRASSEDFLSMCAWCKKVDLGDSWVEVEQAVSQLQLFERSLLPRLTHGICQACYAEIMKVLVETGDVPKHAPVTAQNRAGE
jgi:hypothetical protein